MKKILLVVIIIFMVAFIAAVAAFLILNKKSQSATGALKTFSSFTKFPGTDENNPSLLLDFKTADLSFMQRKLTVKNEATFKQTLVVYGLKLGDAIYLPGATEPSVFTSYQIHFTNETYPYCQTTSVGIVVSSCDFKLNENGVLDIFVGLAPRLITDNPSKEIVEKYYSGKVLEAAIFLSTPQNVRKMTFNSRREAMWKETAKSESLVQFER